MNAGEDVLQEEYQRMLAAVAHDLKTPLVFIRSAASQLQLPDMSADYTTQQLRRMESSAQRLLALVDGVIGSAQANQLQLPLVPLSVADVVHAAVDDISGYAQQLGFDLDIRLSQNLPPVLSHKLSLRRVLFNLMDNALKYTRDQKRVVIRARRDQNHVRITVRDYGVGIKKADIDQIWRLFGRVGEPTHALPGSSGLGLYIAQNLSEAVSAQLAARPLSIGTSFYIRVPIARQLSLFV